MKFGFWYFYWYRLRHVIQAIYPDVWKSDWPELSFLPLVSCLEIKRSNLFVCLYSTKLGCVCSNPRCGLSFNIIIKGSNISQLVTGSVTNRRVDDKVCQRPSVLCSLLHPCCKYPSVIDLLGFDVSHSSSTAERIKTEISLQRDTVIKHRKLCEPVSWVCSHYFSGRQLWCAVVCVWLGGHRVSQYRAPMAAWCDVTRNWKAVLQYFREWGSYVALYKTPTTEAGCQFKSPLLGFYG